MYLYQFWEVEGIKMIETHELRELGVKVALRFIKQIILISQIKNKCSDESWLTYKEIRDVIPLIAKMAEHLKVLV